MYPNSVKHGTCPLLWIGLVAALAAWPGCAVMDAGGRVAPHAPPPAGVLFPWAAPSLPGAVRAVSNYTYQSTDTLTMEGGSWDGGTLNLGPPDPPDPSGLRYAVLGCLAGGQLCTGIQLSGACSGLWLGVSDYGRGAWRWLAGPLNAPGTTALPQGEWLNAPGELFIALVCPAGSTAAITPTLLITEPGQTVTLGAPLGQALRPLLGVNAGPYHADGAGNADLGAEYAELGVNYVRTHDFYGPLDLVQMYADRTKDPALEESYSFAASDVRWRAIVDCGAQPYFRLGDSYNLATPPDGAAQRDNMALAAVEIVRHYHDGQWNGFSTPFSYVEIWNEPDGAFWPLHSTLEFFQFYAAVASALKTAYPGLMVGGPGFTPAGYLVPAGQDYVRSFLDYMEANIVPLDFLSWHMYSNTPTEYGAAAAWYREQLDAYGFSAAQSHLTEYNTQIDESPPADQGPLRTGGRGASVLTAAWIALQQAPVDLAMFYRGNDTDISVPTFYGMYYADGQPKKIAQAFGLWHLMTGFTEMLEASAVKTGGGASPLWALGGHGAGSAQALLVVNPSGAATTYNLAFGDGSFPHNHALSLREVNDTQDGLAAAACSGIGVSIDAYTVQLLTVDE